MSYYILINLVNPFAGGVRYQYRVTGYDKKYYKNAKFILASKKESNRNLIKRLKYIEATIEERVDYFIDKLNTSRSVLSSKQNNKADYKLIKTWIMECVATHDYIKANEIIEKLVEDLKVKDDSFTPIIKA